MPAGIPEPNAPIGQNPRTTKEMSLRDTMKPQHSGSVFADFKHIDAYIADGTLPAIHDQMGVAMAQIPPADRTGAIDFGACHGMLAIRAKTMGWTKVLGLELDAPSVDVFNLHLRARCPGVTMAAVPLDVRAESFRAQAREWVQQGLTTWLARRVLSELFATTYKSEGAVKKHPEDADPWARSEAIWKPAGHAFAEAARDAGVRYLVLQGRAYGPYKDRVAHPIYNTEREIYALGPAWRETFRHKDAVVMVPA